MSKLLSGSLQDVRCYGFKRRQGVSYQKRTQDKTGVITLYVIALVLGILYYRTNLLNVALYIEQNRRLVRLTGNRENLRHLARTRFSLIDKCWDDDLYHAPTPQLRVDIDYSSICGCGSLSYFT